VVSDVLVDDEAPLVTSGISRFVGAQSFGDTHRVSVCVRVFVGVSVCACCERMCIIGDFGQSPNLSVLNPAEVLIGVGLAYVYS
jgi:hypothetical protein